jgi:hypothetical protein
LWRDRGEERRTEREGEERERCVMEEKIEYV